MYEVVDELRVSMVMTVHELIWNSISSTKINLLSKPTPPQKYFLKGDLFLITKLKLWEKKETNTKKPQDYCLMLNECVVAGIDLNMPLLGNVISSLINYCNFNE